MLGHFDRFQFSPAISILPPVLPPATESRRVEIKTFAHSRPSMFFQRLAICEGRLQIMLARTAEYFLPASARLSRISRNQTGVRAEPPNSPVLLDYGAGFAAFIAQFAPAAALSYLPDVARIERAWIEAYHAQEAVPLEAEAFMAIEAGQLAGIRLRLHPSCRIIRSPTPALTIWRMNVDGGVPAPVDVAAGGEDAFVIRPLAQVHVRLMPPGGAEFVLALAAGKSVAQALQSAMAGACGFDLSACLAGLVDAGAFVGYSFAAEAPARGRHA